MIMLRLVWRQRKSAFGWVLVDRYALQHDCPRARRHLGTFWQFDLGRQARQGYQFYFCGTTDIWCLARARILSSLQHTATI